MRRSYCRKHNNDHHCHRSLIPGLHIIHSFLHDRVSWYRWWHHYRYRPHFHLLWFLGSVLIFLGFTAQIFQPSSVPVRGATGILKEFPFQGRLTNSDGTVVSDGSYDVVFKLYTVSSGGTADWTESHTGVNQVSTTDGIFSTNLGSITSLGSIDFNTDTWYLGITVGTDAEMTPRIRLGAAPYSLNSEEVGGRQESEFALLAGRSGGQTLAGGTDASDTLTLQSTSNATKGKVLFGSSAYDEVNDRLGIGTTTPGASLDINPSVATLHLDSSGTGSGDGPIFKMTKGHTSQAASLQFYDTTNIKWNIVSSATNNDLTFYNSVSTPVLSLLQSSGKVGIGTASPTNDLSFDGDSARKIWLERHTVAGAGNDLTIEAGGAKSGETNTAGGNLILSSGISTGNATSKIFLKTATGGAGSGTIDNTPATVLAISGAGAEGIMTESPQDQLHIYSPSSLSYLPRIRFERQSARTWRLGMDTSPDIFFLGDTTSSLTPLAVEGGTGAIGMGTTNPDDDTVLHLKWDNSASNGVLKIETGGTTPWALQVSNGTQTFQAYTNASGNLAGSAQWQDASSKKLKHAFKVIDGRELIGKLKKLNVQEWSYKTDKQAKTRHFGPFSEDFYRVFGLGDSEGIAAADLGGVALGVVKYQQDEIERLQRKVDNLEKQIKNLNSKE